MVGRVDHPGPPASRARGVPQASGVGVTYQGKIVVASTRCNIAVHANFAAQADRNAWLDAGTGGGGLQALSVSSSITGGGAAPLLYTNGSDARNDVLLTITRTTTDGAPNTAYGYAVTTANTTTMLALNFPDHTLVPYIIVLGGQSNMSGRGLLADVPASGYPVNPNSCHAFMFDYLIHMPAYDPVHSNANFKDVVIDDPNAAVGPGLAVADNITQNRTRPVLLVPCAMAGTSSTQWQPGANHQDRTTLYGQMVYRSLQAQTLTGGTVTALIWYQGENDAVTGQSGSYATNTANIFSNYRTDLSNASLPIYVVELPSTSATPGYNDWQTVRAAQAALAGMNTYVVQAPNGPWTSSDQLHLTTAAQRTNGANIASAWLANN